MKWIFPKDEKTIGTLKTEFELIKNTIKNQFAKKKTVENAA